MNKKIDNLLTFLTKRKISISPLLILTHDYPDPDSIASAFALQYMLKNFYEIDCKIAYGGIVGRMENRAMIRNLKVPLYKLKSSDLKKYKNVALVDTQPSFKNNSFPKNRKALIVIDQHITDIKPNADFSLIDTDCGATSVLLAKMLMKFERDIPTRIATALVYGILTDTLNLYRVKRKDIINTYLGLLPYCDMKILSKIQNPRRDKIFFETLIRGISKAKTKKGLIISHLGNISNPDFVAQTADLLLTYKRKYWSLASGRYKGQLYLSFRTLKSHVHAVEILRDVIAEKGDAGGHDTIAGGSIKVSLKNNKNNWEKLEEDIATSLVKRLRLPLKSEFHFPFKENDK